MCCPQKAMRRCVFVVEGHLIGREPSRGGAAAHTFCMTTSATTAPHQPASFRFKATGRVWDAETAGQGEIIRLTGNFFGEGSYVRVFVTPEELTEDYEPVGV